MTNSFTRRVFLRSLAAASIVGGYSFAAESGAPGRRRIERIPPRRKGAPTGSEFALATAPLKGAARQQQAVEQLLAGNVPDFLRTLVPVALDLKPRRRPSHGPPVAWIWVLPDYLAIGDDLDFLRVPLTLPSAVRLGTAWDMLLPTRKIVDAVYRQAEVKLDPRPMRPGPRMRSAEYYKRHHDMIEEARGNSPLGALTAGHKKDVVITKQLLQRQNRIAIYGWHNGEDDPIQPLSTVHGARYADYSHGLRLVDNLALFRGEERRLDQLMADSATAAIFTFEGELPRRLLNKR